MFIITVVLLVAAITFGLMAWRLWHAERERSEARVASLAAALDGHSSVSWPSAPIPAPVAVESLFETERHSLIQGRPLMKVAIGLTMAVALIVIIAMTSVRREAPPSTAESKSSSLELLSMTHSQDGETLTVTGLVRNSGGRAVQGIAAVVFAFDRSGSLVTSGRAQLDDSTIGPGDQSPFQVVVPHAGDVGRYRVSFRTEAGIVRHVDRRHETKPLPEA